MSLLPKANFVVTYPDKPLLTPKTFPTEEAARTFAITEAAKRRMRVSIFDPITAATETIAPPQPVTAPVAASADLDIPTPPQEASAPAVAVLPPVYAPRIPRAIPEPVAPMLRPLASSRTRQGPNRPDRTPRTTRTEPEAPTSW